MWILFRFFSIIFYCVKKDIFYIRKNCTVLVLHGINKLVLTGNGWGNENGYVIMLNK